MKNSYSTDRASLCFLVLSMSYLLTGILFGVAGSVQYLLPPFLKEQLSFQKTRPLHVYLVIAWIFTAAQGLIYYFIPRVAKRTLYWKEGVWIHFYMQLFISLGVIVAFTLGYFSGREYLEFPPVFGLLIIISWIPFAINFFATVKPDYRTAPVYIWSWSAGIVFFFITMSESYLWLADYFRSNIIRDVTVQWKALGSMVGSWNMLVYGTGFYLMERMSGDKTFAKKPITFFFFFLGLTNLMFNWGHHTYVVPAAPWVKTTAYVISMTELLILGNIIWQWRKTVSQAQLNFNRLPFRLMSFADLWIFLNLALAISISIPALNVFTHGTHITVAHAMGATIGINTMLLFAGVFYVIKKQKPALFGANRKLASAGIYILNISLVFFWASLIGSGLVKISATLHNVPFYAMMQKCVPMFRLFAGSGLIVLIGIIIIVVAAFRSIFAKENIMVMQAEVNEPKVISESFNETR
jgi:nitric oxide reductase subunit B